MSFNAQKVQAKKINKLKSRKILIISMLINAFHNLAFHR